MKSAEQPDRDLQQGVHDSLGQAGHRVAGNDLKPDDTSPLENIQRVLGDKAYDIGTTLGATVGSEVNYDRATGGKSWLRTLGQRALERLRLLRGKKAV